MIRFRNWKLTGEIDARQYDDYTAEFRVVGLPLGWVKWDLFWNFGSHNDEFSLEMDESGTAGTVLFNKDNLAFAGIYRAQLRGTNAAGGEKHTDTLELEIDPSFSEDANWPEIPRAFQDYVDTVGEQIGEAVQESVGVDIESQIKHVLEVSELALTMHNENPNAHEEIRLLIANLSNSISGFETPSGASAKVAAHNIDNLAHNDIRNLISTLTTRLNAVANSEDIDLDQLAELVAYIKANRSLIESITTTKVSYSDIVNDLNTNDARKPLSAQMGAELKNLIGTGGGSGNVYIGTEQTPLAEYKAAFDDGKACFMLRDLGTSKVMYTICQVTNDVVHLARTASSGLVEFGALSASGTLSFQTVSYATEITATTTAKDNYVPTAKAVKSEIDGYTLELQDWVRQGFAGKADLPTVPDWARQDQKPTYTKSEVGLGNVDNVRQYSADNPPPYPVRSVNGKTGAVSLGASDVGARPSTWTPSASDVGAVPTSRTVNSKALSSNIALTASDVGAVPTSRKVNNKALTGDISLSASDVGARPSTWTPSASDVGAVPTSRTVNGKALSSNITLSASDVGAAPDGYGLGKQSPSVMADANVVTPAGFLRVTSSTANLGGATHYSALVLPYNADEVIQMHARTTTGAIRFRRTDDGGETWVSEWLNPAMVSGSEYATTERSEGKTVYARRVSYTFTQDIGNEGTNTDYSIPHSISGFKRLVRCYATDGTSYPLPYYTSGGGHIAIKSVDDTAINIRAYKATMTARTLYFDVFFTKE